MESEDEKKLFISLKVGQACQGMRSGSQRLGLSHAQVLWQEAKTILHQYFHSLASRQDRVVCRIGSGQSWNQ